MARWDASHIPDLTGQIAIVTGATAGLGREVAHRLAEHGAKTVIACRDTRKGDDVAKRIEGDTSVIHLDLADLSTVRTFADEVRERFERVDILVNNAGVMALPHRTTVDGFEMQLGVNHLGHFALTGLMLPLLNRVVTVTSGFHYVGRINFANLQGEKRYFSWTAYASSKLANMLFAIELDRRAEGSGLLSLAAHPGYAATDLQTRTGTRLYDLGGALLNQVIAQKCEDGALPLLYAATVPDLPGGALVGPDRVLRGHPKLVRSSRGSHNRAVARRLWKVSEELTGVTYPFATTP